MFAEVCVYMANLLSRKKALKQGLKFYFTGIPCAAGHVAQRRVIGYKCVQCEHEYRINNREHENLLARERYIVNRQGILSRKKMWRQKNHEKELARYAKAR